MKHPFGYADTKLMEAVHMANLTVAQEKVLDNIPSLGENLKKSLQFRVFCKSKYS